jgi:hypothetical protein
MDTEPTITVIKVPTPNPAVVQQRLDAFTLEHKDCKKVRDLTDIAANHTIVVCDAHRVGIYFYWYEREGMF